MNSIQAFLNPIPFEPIQAPVSQRYLDEAGNPILWEFRPISHKENEAINRRCMRRDSKGEHFDLQGYKEGLVAASIAYPDLSDAALQEALGTQGDEVKTMKALLPVMGEFAAAYQAACQVNGLLESPGDLLDEAKNASGRA